MFPGEKKVKCPLYQSANQEISSKYPCFKVPNIGNLEILLLKYSSIAKPFFKLNLIIKFLFFID